MTCRAWFKHYIVKKKKEFRIDELIVFIFWGVCVYAPDLKERKKACFKNHQLLHHVEAVVTPWGCTSCVLRLMNINPISSSWGLCYFYLTGPCFFFFFKSNSPRGGHWLLKPPPNYQWKMCCIHPTLHITVIVSGLMLFKKFKQFNMFCGGGDSPAAIIPMSRFIPFNHQHLQRYPSLLKSQTYRQTSSFNDGSGRA